MPNHVCDVCGEPILIAINMNDGVCSENCRKALAEIKTNENTLENRTSSPMVEMTTAMSALCELCGSFIEEPEIASSYEEGVFVCPDCVWRTALEEADVYDEPDFVNHPPHYTAHPSGVECITITEHMNFCLGNAMKYIWRAGEKGDALQDLEKAAWYLNREIRRRRQN